MLANPGAQIESDSVPDQPPANWYTDPTDESQYRYWDGSAWTEHRAPRYAEDFPKPLRGPNRLIGDSVRIMRRQWRGCRVVALLSVAAYVLAGVLIVYSADLVLNGEFDEILDRISQPSFDPQAPENEAYFESLEVDFSVLNFVPAVLGLLITWLAGKLMTATVALLALGELRGDTSTVSAVLRKAWGRIPRLLGLDLQILALAMMLVAIIVLAAVTVPLALILVIPAVAVAMILAFPVSILAYVVASIGPAESSLRYAYRLVRKRFWGTFGRTLLLIVIVGVVSFAFGAVTGLLGLFWVLTDLLNGVVSAVLALLFGIATAILYLDLGGESE